MIPVRHQPGGSLINKLPSAYLLGMLSSAGTDNIFPHFITTSLA